MVWGPGLMVGGPGPGGLGTGPDGPEHHAGPAHTCGSCVAYWPVIAAVTGHSRTGNRPIHVLGW